MAAPTPKQLGYTMPAEWEKHSAVWLAWPHDPVSFPDRVEKVEETYCEIIATLIEKETVNLIVKDEATRKKTEAKLKDRQIKAKNNAVIFFIADQADIWTRDFCPTFLVNRKTRKLGALKWRYNGYGNKFPELIKDGLIAETLKPAFKSEAWFTPDIVMEGGAIEVNGQGTLVTTEQCLLNPNRNPGLAKTEVEIILKNFLGIKKIIWLKEGVIFDPTDGHIDDLVRFTDEHTILCAYEDDLNHPNHAILDQAYNTLRQATDQDEQPFKVIKLPMPRMGFDRPMYFETTMAPASYANFYIANQVVLVPQFNDANDKPALEIIRSLFPERKAIGIDCTDLLYGGGAIHCMTQQQPAI